MLQMRDEIEGDELIDRHEKRVSVQPVCKKNTKRQEGKELI